MRAKTNQQFGNADTLEPDLYIRYARKPMKQSIETITRNSRIAEGYFELESTWSGSHPAPGQFLTIRFRETTDPLLRRPFAFSAYTPDSATQADPALIRMIYERRGKATKALATAEPGDTIDLLGPLGRPFPAPSPSASPVLVAGGIGVGPILFLASTLVRAGKAPVCVIGGQTAKKIPHEVFDRIGLAPIICTEDGTDGVRGTVLDGLSSPAATAIAKPEYFTCGPHAMMSAVAKLASVQHAECWVSMEQTMGCGVGACMGCAIRVNGPEKFARVCVEGPVFDATQIIW